jgi:hypothetical protein
MHSHLFAPVIALVCWSLAMTAWMYATRIPAIVKHRIVYDPYRPNAEFHAQIPPRTRWKADNLDNLMEQPTLFYAVALTLALLGADTLSAIVLAWAYVAIRVVHSIVQATVNTVAIRFPVFVAGTLVLLALTVQAALRVF